MLGAGFRDAPPVMDMDAGVPGPDGGTPGRDGGMAGTDGRPPGLEGGPFDAISGDEPSRGGGCGCTVPADRDGTGPAWAVLRLLAAFVVVQRRRRWNGPDPCVMVGAWCSRRPPPPRAKPPGWSTTTTSSSSRG